MSNPWEIQTIEYDRTNSEGNADVTGYGQIAILLSKYVLKEKGKGLSSNDFTDNDVLKLNSIEVGAEVNKLETLTVNRGSKIYPTTDKNINLNIPTKVSELDNDLGYAKLENASLFPDYSDSYVGKSKISFQDEEKIAIGKNSNADDGGIAIGENTSTSETYDVNIANELKHNVETDIWEGKFEESVTALQNTNGTNLTELDTVISDLADEVQNRIDADTTLQDNIDLEIQNRTDADDTLQGNIDTATQRIDDIEDLIPNQASTSNQLADKSFVNSSIQTTTANFRGSWDTWGDVPTDPSLYPQDFAGNRTPTTNDYMVVQNASDYTYDVLSGTWRFKYSGNWNTDGKNGWLPEYQVNEEPFTSEQLYAINSGITSAKVTQYDNHISDTNNPHSVTKCQVGLGDVVNTGDSDTPTSGGLTKFTTGGAYTELAKKQDKCLSSPITIHGTQECTVESALSAINDYVSCELYSDLSTHISDTSNPHSVTATQVGLGNVCNVGTDSCVTQGSTNNVSSDAVYNAICDLTSCEGTVTVCDSCDNCDIPLALCTDTTSVGKSACCPLTYNPTTGVLSATCFCGTFSGSVTNSICTSMVKYENVCESEQFNYPIVLCTGRDDGGGDPPYMSLGVEPTTLFYNPLTNEIGASIRGCACGVYTEGVSDNANYDIGLLAVSTSGETALVRHNSAHKITYNPSTCTLSIPKINVCCSTIQYNADNQSLEFNI